MIETHIRITDIDPAEIKGLEEHIGDAIEQATCAVAFDAFGRVDGPAVHEWDRFVSDCVKHIAPEMAPKIEAMILEAIRSRLPWETDKPLVSLSE